MPSNPFLFRFRLPIALKMFGRTSSLAALAAATLVAAQTTSVTCDPTTLNTTSFDYYIDVANQTVYEMAVKFNRGVCDIGRANLSSSHQMSLSK